MPSSHVSGQSSSANLVATKAEVVRAVAALLAVSLLELAEEREAAGGDSLPIVYLTEDAVALCKAVRVLTEGAEVAA